MRRAARQGEPHSDPYVAQLARAWATEVLRMDGPRPSGRRRVSGLGLGAALLAVIGALLGPAAGALRVGGLSRRDRRLARRVLASTPPPPEPGER